MYAERGEVMMVRELIHHETLAEPAETLEVRGIGGFIRAQTAPVIVTVSLPFHRQAWWLRLFRPRAGVLVNIILADDALRLTAGPGRLEAGTQVSVERVR